MRCLTALALAVCFLAIHARCQTSEPTTPAPSTPGLQIALTFDDLPAHGPLPPAMARPAVVKSILATLKQEKLPPVYGFVNGFRLGQYPYQVHILQAWHNAGEPMGNHTYSHPSLDETKIPTYEADITHNEATLKKVDPKGDWHWFRYPYLQEGNTQEKHEAIRAYLKQHGYRVAEVTMDFQDYAWNDAYGRCSLQKNTTPAQKAQAYAQLHDSYLANADKFIDYSRSLSRILYNRDIPYVLLLHVGSFDAKMLPDLIDLYRKRGFTFVTLEQAESDPAYDVDPGIAAPGGGLLTEMEAVKRKASTPDVTGAQQMLDAICQ